MTGTLGLDGHRAACERLRADYGRIPAGQPVRLAKRTSNLFRAREGLDVPGLDVGELDHVLSVDPERLVAQVQGMTTYEQLVDATLSVGTMPLVVPQLRTITLGGAVTGLGIESSSFRNGLPHESVREMEILTGSGEVVVARPDNEHADLFRAFPNSYGSLGYALRLEIELERVHRFVRLRHVRFHDLDTLMGALDDVVRTRSHDGEDVDFVDGVVFSAEESYLTLGTLGRRGAVGQRLHRPGDLLPLDPAASRSTTSPRATTCGAGTPTGSGAPGRSGCRTRGCAGSGPGATCAATPTPG